MFSLCMSNGDELAPTYLVSSAGHRRRKASPPNGPSKREPLGLRPEVCPPLFPRSAVTSVSRPLLLSANHSPERPRDPNAVCPRSPTPQLQPSRGPGVLLRTRGHLQLPPPVGVRLEAGQAGGERS